MDYCIPDARPNHTAFIRENEFFVGKETDACTGDIHYSHCCF